MNTNVRVTSETDPQQANFVTRDTSGLQATVYSYNAERNSELIFQFLIKKSKKKKRDRDYTYHNHYMITYKCL
jgi:hypothetical protein